MIERLGPRHPLEVSNLHRRAEFIVVFSAVKAQEPDCASARERLVLVIVRTHL